MSNPDEIGVNNPIKEDDPKCDIEGDGNILIFETLIDPSPSIRHNDIPV